MFLKRLAAIALVALSSTAAFAKEITVSFDVRSSGPSIYACNAGIKHPAPTAQYCHVMGSTQACVSGSQNCVCTGVSGGGYLMDYMTYRLAGWVDAGQTATWGPQVAAKSGESSYNNAVAPHNSLNTMIDRVTFNLGSEVYGACYYMDICYRGPQIDYFNQNPLLNVTANFVGEGRVTITGLNPQTAEPIPGQSDYVNVARPKGKVVVHCDLQGQGTQTIAANSSGQLDTTVNDIDWANFHAGAATSTSDWSFVSGLTTLTTSTHYLFPATWITSNSSKTPRFCVVRYEFCETEGPERKWTRHDARFKTFTRIEEPNPS